MRLRLRVRGVSRVAAALAVTVAVTSTATMVNAQGVDHGGYRPHFQGPGTSTPGGRGGTIYRVTTLADDGPGSLRAALNAVGPRFVIFEVSGTIALTQPIYIRNPFVTVAGQTSPSPGILIRNHSVYIDTNDVVLQHLRLRMGDTTCVNNCADSVADALYIRNNAFDVVLDHLSISWGTHSGITVNAWSGTPPYNIAILDTIVAENLAKPKNPFGVGTLFMPSTGAATFARNLHAHNGNRNPWVAPGWTFAGYNNVAYNAGNVAGDQGTLAFFQFMGGYGFGGPTDLVWRNNVAIAGPNTHVDGKAVKIDLYALDVSKWRHRLFMADNIGPHQTAADQWNGVTFMNAATAGVVRSDSLPSWYANTAFDVKPTSEVVSHVLANAGARPLDRDSVDKRIVRDVTNKTGSRIASPSEVGGYPVLAEVRRTLSLPADPHAVADAAGRTRIEVWLEGYARALEPTSGGSTTLTTPRNVRQIG